MIVVDASVVLEILLRTAAAARAEQRVFGVEVAQVLRRYEARGELEAARGREALADLVDFPLARYPHDLLLPRIWELRANLTAYDAAYVALAEALETTLLTCDARLARAPGMARRTELIGQEG
jgi:predicted nucleic acid-binding protein